jgi:hypothetical protein
MKKVILTLAVSIIITGIHPLTILGPAQAASCKSEYDLCRRVRVDFNRTKPVGRTKGMVGSCEARYAQAQRTGTWKSRFGGVRECGHPLR